MVAPGDRVDLTRETPGLVAAIHSVTKTLTILFVPWDGLMAVLTYL